MRALIAKFMALPIPGKAMIGMVMAGGVFGLCALAGLTELGYFIGIAMAVVTVVLAIFGLVMEKRDKKKAADVEASIADSAAATPSGVNKVADRAKLDDLRRQFETGVQTFRDYGKNLYDMPWYVVVGEPGSGKTEAIRHSGIGFPPGLQDQLQGTGGTVNMNWWFTDQAVVLDTAGRLMFEDVAPGENNEWKEFLKLLRTSRANCPINGMLLVIPADTLITDKPDEIEKKAGKIAQQFDQIQRSLGVRFPVFVLITKADLINGFREFFDDITDPRLTAQMLGWSNPADLDEPFRPERVEDHLDSLRQHLLQRRFALLQNPIHTEDPKGRRIDQVDALYKFPEAVTELAPRLRRYLEMIFVAGEWSQKPLFLRGIYFTSSMRDGDALDADLAEVLGVGVDALPEGKLWERERSYFLRDLFLDKVFKERGLVTRAANAGQVKRKRAMLISGAVAAASVLLGGMIWYSYSQTKSKIQNPRDFWVEVQGAVEDVASEADNDASLTPPGAIRKYLSPLTIRTTDPTERDLIVAQPLESGNASVRVDGTKLTYLEVFEKARKYYEENSSSSGLFALVAALPGGGNDIFKRQLPTQRSLFEQLMLVRAANIARQDLLEDGRNRAVPVGWSSSDLGPSVLSTLIGFEADRVLSRTTPIDTDAFIDLVRFAVASETDESLDEDSLARLRAYTEWVYGAGGGWPPTTLATGTEESITAIDEGIASFNQRWRDPRGEGALFGHLRTLRETGTALSAAEEALAGASNSLNAAVESAAYTARRAEWNAAYEAYDQRFAAFNAALANIPERYIREGFVGSGIAETARLAVWASASEAYDAMLAAFGDESEWQSLDPEKEDEARLLAWRERLVDERAAAESSYREKADQLVASVREGVVANHLALRGAEREFGHRRNIYASAKEMLDRDPSGTDDLADALEEIETTHESETRLLAGEGLVRTRDAANAVASAAARHARYRAMTAELERLGDWKQLLSAESPDPLPAIPLTTLASLQYEPRFAPANHNGVRGSFDALLGYIDQPTEDGSPFVLDQDELKRTIAGMEGDWRSHAEDYERFWTEDVPAALVINPAPGLSWGDLQAELQTSRRIFDAFEDLRELMASALGEPDAKTSERAASLARAVREEDEDTDLRAMIRNDIVPSWRRLADDPGQAGETLRLSAEQGQIMDAYFPLEQTAEFKEPWEVGPEETYWRSFSTVAIEQIARGAVGEQERAILDVEPLCRRFPLTLDATPQNGLSASEISRVASVLGEVGVLTSSEAIRPGVSPFERIRSQVIRGALDRISGLSLMQDGARVDRLRRSLRVARFLDANAGEITFTLAAQDINYPPNKEQGTDQTCENIQIEGKRDVYGGDGFTLLTQGREIFTENFTWTLPMQGRAQVRFESSGHAPVTSSIGGWGALAALPGEPERFPGGEMVWPLPLRLSSGRTYWMGAVFAGGEAESLSDMRRDWPRESDWR